MLALTRRRTAGAWLIGCLGIALSATADPPRQASAADGVPSVDGASPIEAGRYLVIVGSCNDCHTDGYLQTAGKVPEDAWLLGSTLGWRGPWGTTYPPNLRLTVQDLTEDAWVNMLRTRQDLPPMPWAAVNRISESDARAIYQYIRSLGPAGKRAPAAVPPEREPATAYYSLAPIEPASK